MVTVDRTLLEAALVGYERQRDDIEAKIAEIRQHIGTGSAATQVPATPGRKRTMNAAARARIAEAQKKRWAEYKKTQGTSAKPAKVKKRVLSAAAVKHISEATKKRWAAYRAAKAAGQKAAKSARKGRKPGPKKAAVAQETAEANS